MTQPVESTLAEAPFHRLSVDDVMKMVDAGILDDHAPVELIDGVLCMVPPEGPLHRTVKITLRERLVDAYRGRAHVFDQDPVFADDHSLPEPDLAVVRGEPETYIDSHPRGPDLVLVVEVSLTSQRRDRRKAALYARAGFATYWLLDLAARRVAVYTRPDVARAEYLELSTLEPEHEVTLPELDVRWAVSTLLP
jgi:Uma2 family endonuclease